MLFHYLMLMLHYLMLIHYLMLVLFYYSGHRQLGYKLSMSTVIKFLHGVYVPDVFLMQ